jgi:hypothetical protein
VSFVYRAYSFSWSRPALLRPLYIVYSFAFVTVFHGRNRRCRAHIDGMSQSFDRCRLLRTGKVKEMKSRLLRIVFVALGLINQVELITKTYVSIR